MTKNMNQDAITLFDIHQFLSHTNDHLINISIQSIRDSIQYFFLVNIYAKHLLK